MGTCLSNDIVTEREAELLDPEQTDRQNHECSACARHDGPFGSWKKTNSVPVLIGTTALVVDLIPVGIIVFFAVQYTHRCTIQEFHVATNQVLVDIR